MPFACSRGQEKPWGCHIKVCGPNADVSSHVPLALDVPEGALLCPGFPTAANHAALLLSMIFGVSHTMVLHSPNADDRLVMQDGLGWKPGTVGHALFETGPNTLAGVTLSSPEPVSIEDLADEARFAVPAPLSGYGLVSGLCATIPGDHFPPGILGVFSKASRTFTPGDFACIGAIAGMLAVPNGCHRVTETRLKDQERIAHAKKEWEATVDALPHFICLLDEKGTIVRANRSVDRWVASPTGDLRGRTPHEVLHSGCQDNACDLRAACEQAASDAMKGRHVVFETDDDILKRRLEIQLHPTARQPPVATQPTSRAVLVMQDVTRIKRAEELLRNVNNYLEDVVRERTAALLQANERLRKENLERRRVEDELRQSENDMRLLSAQLLTVQEMERKRIAAELHDGISQSLTAIKFYIANAVGLGVLGQGAKADEFADTALVRIQDAIEEVHRISTNLRPAMLDDLGIIPTIAWFCREFQSVYSDIQVDTYVDIAEDDVSAQLKTIIYRILQEALNNIAKHAKARDVNVRLVKSNSMIEFVVQDSGIGFDPGSSLRGVTRGTGVDIKGSGIGSMRERVEFSGGTVEIKSEPGIGTRIRASWPTPR